MVCIECLAYAVIIKTSRNIIDLTLQIRADLRLLYPKSGELTWNDFALPFCDKGEIAFAVSWSQGRISERMRVSSQW